MKNLLAISAIFLSISAIARPIQGTIDSVFCGEFDPYSVGDACIVFTSDKATGTKLGLVYKDYNWSYEFIPSNKDVEITVGKAFKADLCTTISSYEQIRELKSYNSDYFYLNCNLRGFSFLK